MKYSALVVVALGMSLVLTSCNKEDIAPSGTHTEQPVAEGAELVNIDLTSLVQQAEEVEMRFSYRDRDFYAKDEEGNEIPVVYPIMQEKPLNILVVARQSGGTTMYNKLVFTKTLGERKATFSGKIKVPNTGTGTIELAAIVLSEVGGREFVRYNEATNKVSAIPSTSLQKADNGFISTTVPYIARWTPITLVPNPAEQDGVKLASPAVLSFKPSGTLVRVEFVNLTDKNESILSFKVRSNSLFLNWYYDFEQLGSQESNTPNTLADGLLTGGITTQEYSFNLPEVIFLDKGAISPSYYFWAMPRSQADQGASDLRTDFVVTLQEGDGGSHEYKRISGNFLLRTGSARLVKLYPSYGKTVTAP